MGSFCEEVALFMTSRLRRLNCRDCSRNIFIKMPPLLGKGGQKTLLSSVHHCYLQHIFWGMYALSVRQASYGMGVTSAGLPSKW